MKLAVIFPGIGYKYEKPILKETIKLLKHRGYGIIKIDYDGFPSDAKNRLNECLEIAVAKSSKALDEINWCDYSEILFVGKSIGTAVAIGYASENKINCKKILITPIPNTFAATIDQAIAFYGTSDPWITREEVLSGCKSNDIPLTVYEDMNHSLICEDENKNAKVLEDLINKIQDFIN